MDWLTDPQAWIALVTLTFLEIVLGIDNVIFISILAGKLPPDQQARARTVGLAGAMLTRIGLLYSISWITKLTDPLFSLFGHPFSGRDLILMGGGLFLIAKATHEIHAKLEGEVGEATARAPSRFGAVIAQIMVLDIVFSIDSVITAVGMARDYFAVMVTAVIIAVLFMMAFAGVLHRFVDRHPTVKMLALSFLILIGVTLVAESFHREIPKGYIYFAMAFSVLVEMLNLRLRKVKAVPVKLHEPYTEAEGDKAAAEISITGS